MVAINLSKALKVKNRLVGRMAKVTGDIERYNSTLEEQVGKFDVAAAISLREELMNSLIFLKTAIAKANMPIQEMLIANGELKAKIQFLSMLSTTDGAERHGYQNTEVKYVAYLKKADVDAQTKTLERTIDANQDQLDAFNANTKIEVPDRLLELAQ